MKFSELQIFDVFNWTHGQIDCIKITPREYVTKDNPTQHFEPFLLESGVIKIGRMFFCPSPEKIGEYKFPKKFIMPLDERVRHIEEKLRVVEERIGL